MTRKKGAEVKRERRKKKKGTNEEAKLEQIDEAVELEEEQTPKKETDKFYTLASDSSPGESDQTSALKEEQKPKTKIRESD